ncbi:hypothetical protein [Parasphingorhabdus marina]|nr:hypothetical protein [Parasphingorhabdus marina]
MTSVKILVRIALAYAAACFAAALGIFLIGSLMTIGQPLMEGVTWSEDMANQAGYLPVYAAMAGILAAPVALLTILISEFGKITGLWFFLLAGAAAGIPVLFRGSQFTLMRALDDFVTLGPVGAAAGAAFWLVRHRKWPI